VAGFPRVRPGYGLALLTVATLCAEREGMSGQVVAQSATAGVMAIVLLWGAVRDRAAQRTRLLLLLAMAIGLVAAGARVTAQLLGGDPNGLFVSLLALATMPVTAAGLLSLPAAERRRGYRMRALADALVAAASLWYLLSSPSVAPGGVWPSLSSARPVDLVVRPVVDVFVVATALAVFARCASTYRRLAAWALAGLTCVAAGDVIVAVAAQHPLASLNGPAAVVNQAGMLMLVAAAWNTRSCARPVRERPWQATAAGVLPFLPLVADMVLTSHLIGSGRPMPTQQLLPALAVAVALTARQFATARDKERLVQQLTVREVVLEQELRRDPLTGLGNRTLLAEVLEAAMADSAAQPVVVALLDLDNFKLINDNHGHETGDSVLMEVANRLRTTCRREDVVVRLGGDEFAVVAHRAADGGAALGARLRAALDQPVVTDRGAFALRASIGIVGTTECESVMTALACADVAMYQAKSRREPQTAIEVLTGQGRERARRQLRIQEEVAAPTLEQFVLAYQPIVELGTGRIRGVEALLRWTHPELGNVPPDVFIPMAETAGSIVALGDHVLQRAVEDLAWFQSLTPDRLAVGVNVSPRQLKDPGLVPRALALLDRHGLVPDQLNIEITEQAFEADLTDIARNLQAFADAGVSIAVDDFGTGYSSLRYLQQLPVDVMKIDRSFVAEACADGRPGTLVSSLVAMANVLQLQLVAEGIETDDQRERLHGMGCELGQGYHFSRPVSADTIATLLTSRLRLPERTEVPTPRDPGRALVS
jgi:diguanylate cyclase (GGDEF)-like protein